jgi:hypothetical protein
MGTKAYVALAFITAANGAIAVMDDKKDNDWSPYLWGAASACYLAAAGLSAKDKSFKQKNRKSEKDKDDRFDIM